MSFLARRSRYANMLNEMRNVRTSHESHWKEISDYVLPRRLRLFADDKNRGERKNQKIINSAATLANRTLRSGMLSGITSPARPWFKLSAPDPDLSKFGPVREWLEEVTRLMNLVYLKSNFYNALPICYGDMGNFATGCLFQEEDFENVVRYYPMPVGSYYIAQDQKLKVNQFYREFKMTAFQLIEKFGRNEDDRSIDWSRFSTHVKSAWDRDLKQTEFTVCHVVEPNENYDPRKLESKFKKFVSVYFEFGADKASSTGGFSRQDSEKVLEEKGYDFFPVLAPRWEVTGEDVYGTDCPGMTALGDVKQLQTMEKRGAQALDKIVNPPMQGPSSLKNQKTSILPGDITYYDAREGNQGFKPTHEINFRLSELENKEQQIAQRISRAYYEDLFLMLAQSDRRQITAREIDERREEKLLALGPVLERLNQDLLDPNTDNTFDIMQRQGLIPPPPPDIQGQELRAEYTSMMAQAQKFIALGGIERFTNYAAGVASFDPTVLDKIKSDKLVDTYADITSIPTEILRTDEEVEELRAARQQQAEAQMKSEQAAMQAGTAKQLSETSVEGDNALNAVLAQANAGKLTG